MAKDDMCNDFQNQSHPCYEDGEGNIPLTYRDKQFNAFLWFAILVFFLASFQKIRAGSSEKDKKSVRNHAATACCTAAFGHMVCAWWRLAWQSHWININYYIAVETTFVGVAYVSEAHMMTMLVFYWMELVEDKGMKKKENVKKMKNTLERITKCYTAVFVVGLALICVGQVTAGPGNFSLPKILGAVMILLSTMSVHLCLLYQSLKIGRQFSILLASMAKETETGEKKLDDKLHSLLNNISLLLYAFGFNVCASIFTILTNRQSSENFNLNLYVRVPFYIAMARLLSINIIDKSTGAAATTKHVGADTQMSTEAGSVEGDSGVTD